MIGKLNMLIIFEIECVVMSVNVQWILFFNGGDMQIFIVIVMYGQYKKIELNIIFDQGENKIYFVYI